MRLNELPVTTFLTGLLFKGHAFGAPGLTAWTWLFAQA
jgi:hypothetical protein